MKLLLAENAGELTNEIKGEIEHGGTLHNIIISDATFKNLCGICLTRKNHQTEVAVVMTISTRSLCSNSW